MAWLNAALAFSITMLIMAMIVSTLVETLHRAFRLRADGLATMLGALFRDAVEPHLAGLAVDLDVARARFVTEMMQNRAGPSSFVGRFLHSECLNKLDVEEFMTRLGASDYGDALRAAAARVDDHLADTVLHDLAHKFESFGREASEHFERRARLSSVLIALVLAWYANVNPYVLIKTYLLNDDVTAKVIALQQEVVDRYEKLQAPASGATGGPANAPSSDGGRTSMVPGAPGAQTGSERKTDSAVQNPDESYTAARADLDRLREAGVPIGWTPARLEAAGFRKLGFVHLPCPAALTEASLSTTFWLLIGGLLIGLGGPFWVGAVRSLSNLRTLLGGEPRPGDKAAGESLPPTKRAVALFKTAAVGRDARLAQGAFNSGADDEPALG